MTSKSSSNAHEPIPLWKTVVAGSSAGVAECLVMFPLDTIKTRIQLSTVPLSTWQCGVNIFKTDPLLFYRGISAPLLAEAPKRAVKFATNNIYQNWFKDKNGNLSNAGGFAAGALAGVSEAVVNTPFEAIKVKMQAPESRAFYKNTVECAVHTYRTEGITGVYKGLEAQSLRNGVWNGLYFGLQGTFHKLFPAPEDASETQRATHKLIIGTIAGCLACVNIPLDVVKSRVQNQRLGETKYNWAIPALRKIAVEEGMSSLFKGLTPKILRLGPGGGIMAVVFDYVVNLL